MAGLLPIFNAQRISESAFHGLSFVTGRIVPMTNVKVVFTQRLKFRFFTSQGRHTALMGLKFGDSAPNFTSSVQGWDVGPQNGKFYEI